jgi:hypothetical protein
MPAPRDHQPWAGPLLRLERQARRHGTGVVAADLSGCWRLQQVWPRGGERASAVSGWLLRALAARLEIEADDEGLRLSNAVEIGGLELRFRGRGSLQGRRPLLLFSFDDLEISLGGRRLLHRRLPPVESRRVPFFALIHRDPAGWLAARGRGGGLALWRQAAITEPPTVPPPSPSAMTGNLQAIGFLFSWVLGWGIGGSLIDAGLIEAGVYPLEGGQLGTAATFCAWTLLWGGGGVWLYRRLTGRTDSPPSP